MPKALTGAGRPLEMKLLSGLTRLPAQDGGQSTEMPRALSSVGRPLEMKLLSGPTRLPAQDGGQSTEMPRALSSVGRQIELMLEYEQNHLRKALQGTQIALIPKRALQNQLIIQKNRICATVHSGPHRNTRQPSFKAIT
jgi:hypothetical protein